MILRLFHEGWTQEGLEELAQAIQECYGLEVSNRGSLVVPYGNKLNAAELLSNLGRCSGAHLSLWLVNRRIFLPEAGDLFGCTAGRSAILSRAGLEQETWIKEALHEVGHLLGLGHCQGECVMSFSSSLAEARAKPLRLCPCCKAMLNQDPDSRSNPP